MDKVMIGKCKHRHGGTVDKMNYSKVLLFINQIWERRLDYKNGGKILTCKNDPDAFNVQES